MNVFTTGRKLVKLALLVSVLIILTSTVSFAFPFHSRAPVVPIAPINDAANNMTDSVTDQSVDVIVELTDSSAKRVMTRSMISKAQSKALSSLKSDEFKVKREFSSVPVVALTVKKSALAKLQASSSVKRVYTNGLKYPLLQDTVPLINADDTQNMAVEGTSLTGKGVGICVIDTGVDSTHPAFGNRVIAQKCFCSQGGGCCPGGVSESNDAMPVANSGGEHGTHIAGIAAGNGAVKGVAPEANIIAVRVFNDALVPAAADADIISAIDYCVANRDVYNIYVITISLGDHVPHTIATCNSPEESAINAARAVGMIVTVAAGNDALTTGIAEPACVAAATAVGITDKYDSLYVLASRGGDALDIYAPGTHINSAIPGGGYGEKTGSSMSTPHVAGAAALLFQHEKLLGKSITPDAVEALLKSTAVDVGDTLSAGRPGRVDVYAAMVKLDKGYTMDYASSKFWNSDGSAQFKNSVNLNMIWACTNISANYASVDGSVCPQYNTPADVKLSGLSFTNPHVEVDMGSGFVDCPSSTCTGLTYSGGIASFTVSQAAAYRLAETVGEKGVNLTVDTNSVTAPSGHNATFTVTVGNNGTTEQTYALAIDNLDGASVAKLSKTSVTLADGASEDVLVTVGNCGTGQFDFTVSATDSDDLGISATTSVVTLDVTDSPDTFSVNIVSNSTSSSVQTGTDAAYLLTITNTGCSADTYDLSVSDDLLAALDRSQITLSKDESVDVLLTVFAQSSEGTVDVTVTVADATDASFNETSLVSTTFVASEPSTGCGSTITESFTMSEDLACLANGLTIGADDVVLDCDGYSISYDTDGLGSNGVVAAGRSGITIKNCNIIVAGASSGNGISLRGTTVNANIFGNNITSSSLSFGIYAEAISDSVISGNRISGAYAGIHARDGSGNNITGNNASGNGDGIFLYGISGSEVSDNIADSNSGGECYGGAGICVVVSNSTVLRDNRMENNAVFGMMFDSSGPDNLVINNTISGGGYGSLYLYTSVSSNFTNNMLISDASTAIAIDAGSTDNIFTDTKLVTNSVWISIEGTSTGNTFTNTLFDAADGSIRILPTVTATEGTTVDLTNLAITNNRAFLDSSVLGFFDVAAKIVLNGLSFTNPEPIVDFESDETFETCSAPQCTNVDYTDGTLSFDVTSFTTYSAQEAPEGGNQNDADSDGITDDVDVCPSVAGRAEFSGCPVANSVNVSFRVYGDNGAVCGYNSRGRPNSRCLLPAEGVQVKVFDTANSTFVSAYGRPRSSYFGISSYSHNFGRIFESDIGLMKSCTTGADGTCAMFVGKPSKYVVVTKFVDQSTGEASYRGKVHSFRPDVISAFNNGNGNGLKNFPLENLLEKTRVTYTKVISRLGHAKYYTAAEEEAADSTSGKE